MKNELLKISDTKNFFLDLLIIKSEGSGAPLPTVETPTLESPVTQSSTVKASNVVNCAVETPVTPVEVLKAEVEPVQEIPPVIIQETPVVQEISPVAVQEDPIQEVPVQKVPVQVVPLIEVVTQGIVEEASSSVDEKVASVEPTREATLQDVVSTIEVNSPDFSTLVSELQSKATEAVNQAVEAQDIAAAAIKSKNIPQKLLLRLLNLL